MKAFAVAAVIDLVKRRLDEIAREIPRLAAAEAAFIARYGADDPQASNCRALSDRFQTESVALNAWLNKVKK